MLGSRNSMFLMFPLLDWLIRTPVESFSCDLEIAHMFISLNCEYSAWSCRIQCLDLLLVLVVETRSGYKNFLNSFQFLDDNYHSLKGAYVSLAKGNLSCSLTCFFASFHTFSTTLVDRGLFDVLYITVIIHHQSSSLPGKPLSIFSTINSLSPAFSLYFK